MSIRERASRFETKAFLFSRILVTCVVLFASSHAYSQDEIFERNPHIYTKNSFKISASNGFNRVQFTSENGNDKPRAGIGLAPRLNFDYRFSLGNHLGFNLGAGFGAIPFRFKVDSKAGFSGTEGWSYWHITEYQLHSGLNIGLDYNYWLNERYNLKTTLGFGGVSMSGSHLEIGSTNELETEYLFEYNGERGFFPYISISSGIDRVLKNDNLLGLSFSYEYFLQPIYTGVYSLYNFESSGTLETKGHNIGLSLAYTFTRAGKMKRAEDIIESEQISFKDAKKEFKKERRIIDPKSTFFSLTSGLFFARNQAGSKDNFLKSGGADSWIVATNLEKGIKNNHFLQLGISVSETWSYLRLNRPGVFSYSASNEFISVQTSIGVGTRLISKKSNINYLNVSAGLSIGYQHNPKGPSGSSGGLFFNDSQLSHEYNVLYTTKRNTYPTMYLNLSRDFQLTKTIYLSLDYRFNLGLLNIVEGDAELTTAPDFNDVLTDQINIKGTSNAFQFGIKYRFDPH